MKTSIFDGSYPVTSNYGWRTHPITKQRKFHNGMDFGVPSNTPLKSRGNGTALIVSNNDGYGGKWLVILFDDGSGARYFHLNAHKVRQGQRVHAGQVVALSGNTGRSTGAHLHYEELANGRDRNTHRNPIPFITGSTLPVTNKNMVRKEHRVQRGDSMSSLASRIGVSLQQLKAWNPQITNPNIIYPYATNPGHPFSSVYYYVPAQVEVVKDNPELATLQKKIELANAEIANKDDELLKLRQQMDNALYEAKFEAEEEIANLEAELAAAKAKRDLLELSASEEDLLEHYEDLTSTIVEESVEVDGLLNKYGAFIDKHIKSKTLRSVLKYELFVVLGMVLSAPTLGVFLVSRGVSEQLATGAVFGAGVIVKLLLTRYDKNEDGKLDLQDTQFIKGFAYAEGSDQDIPAP